MARFVYKIATECGHNPCLVCNVLDTEVDVRIADLFRMNYQREIEHTSVDGMELKGIPRYLPEIEFLQYILNRRLWSAALEDGDRFFCVAGASPNGLPLVLENVPFGCWIATPFWEDRVDRLSSSSLLRQFRDHISRPLMGHIEKTVFDSASSVFVLSDYTADLIAERHGIDRSRLQVLPYPIDTNHFTPEGKMAESDGPLILFVGRFNDSRKNTEMLVEAFSNVLEQVPDAVLRLVGDEQDHSLQSKFQEYDIVDSVECVDYIPNEELPALYRAADVFAIPSNQEGLAIVGLEAMACGTPVVSTRCGRPEGYVVDGETGYLVEIGNVDEMTKRLSQVMRGSSDHKRLGERAREIVATEYAESVVVPRFIQALAS